MVVHTVRVGQDAAAADDEAAASAAELPLALPRQAVVGLAVHAEHLRDSINCCDYCGGYDMLLSCCYRNNIEMT